MIKRFWAFLLDYLLILAYAMVIYCLTQIVRHVFRIEMTALSPVIGQLIGFTTLTLPVFFYFYLSERSTYRGTLGKRRMGIAVGNQHAHKAGNVLLRNVLKFLPWEVAHMGVHWVVFYASAGNSTPVWVWILLVFPQITALLYVASIFRYGDGSLYDGPAGTRIVLR